MEQARRMKINIVRSYSMKQRFKIEAVKFDRNRAYVYANIVSAKDFVVSDGATLGGIPIVTELAEPKPCLFRFRLWRVEDAQSIEIGTMADLLC
jgi:hypothetical protein